MSKKDVALIGILFALAGMAIAGAVVPFVTNTSVSVGMGYGK